MPVDPFHFGPLHLAVVVLFLLVLIVRLFIRRAVRGPGRSRGLVQQRVGTGQVVRLNSRQVQFTCDLCGAASLTSRWEFACTDAVAHAAELHPNHAVYR